MTERVAPSAYPVVLAALLTAAAGAATPQAAAEIARLAALLRGVASIAEGVAGAPAARLPVCRWWDAALAGVADGPAAALAAALRALGPRLNWTQNPNYRRRPPDAGFLQNYGYAVIAGPPAAGGRPLVAERRFATGVLLLGPGTHYPLHAHPAAELYVPLGVGEWWRDPGPWRREPVGAVIHHPPHAPHALRAGAVPLLAVYLWRGALATAARLLEAGDDPGA